MTTSLFHLSLLFGGKAGIRPTGGLPEEMGEMRACPADRGRVDDRGHIFELVHQDPGDEISK